MLCLSPARIFCVLFPFLRVLGEEGWLSSTYGTAGRHTARHCSCCTLLPSCMGALGNSHWKENNAAFKPPLGGEC